MAALHIDDFPPGLLRLIEKLAAADGVTVEEAVKRLLYEAMYGPLWDEEASDAPAGGPDGDAPPPGGAG